MMACSQARDGRAAAEGASDGAAAASRFCRGCSQQNPEGGGPLLLCPCLSVNPITPCIELTCRGCHLLALSNLLQAQTHWVHCARRCFCSCPSLADASPLHATCVMPCHCHAHPTTAHLLPTCHGGCHCWALEASAGFWRLMKYRMCFMCCTLPTCLHLTQAFASTSISALKVRA